jgi:hypothetical protein
MLSLTGRRQSGTLRLPEGGKAGRFAYAVNELAVRPWWRYLYSVVPVSAHNGTTGLMIPYRRPCVCVVAPGGKIAAASKADGTKRNVSLTSLDF